MFPADWGKSGGGKKRSRTFLENVEDLEGTGEVGFKSDVKNCIKKRVSTVQGQPDEGTLDLDYILSRIPYRDMLQKMFGGHNPQDAPTIPVISKSFEETFMRQPVNGETACVLGDMCECRFIDKTSPFTCVEFRLPSDPPDVPQMCVLCSRKTTQKLYFDMCYAGVAPHCVIQRYGNIFGQVGEYSIDCMLACPPELSLHSMPVPIMSHQRNRYSVVNVCGSKQLKQHRVSHEPESDFQTPSGAAQA